MKIIHTADLHLGKTINDMPLLNDQRHYLYALLSLAENENADCIVIAGDVYQRSVPPAEAVALFDEFLNGACKKNIKVIAIAGNHDSGERLAFASNLLENSGVFIGARLEPVIKKVTLADSLGEVDFFLLPYFEPYEVRALYGDDSIKTANDAFKALLGNNEELFDSSRRQVLVAHGFFGSSQELSLFSDSEKSVGGSDMVDSSLAGIFDYTALGHLHAPQRAGGDYIRYGGSPLKYSVSEALQKKQVTIVNLGEKGKVDITFKEISPLHDLRVVEGAIDELLKSEKSDDYIFARLTDKGEIYGAMEKLRTVFPSAIGLKFIRDEAEAEFALASSASVKVKPPEELFSEFYSEMLGEEITEKRSEIMLEIFSQARREDSEE